MALRAGLLLTATNLSSILLLAMLRPRIPTSVQSAGDIAVTLSWIVRLIHSATPFCMGVYGTIFWCLIPFSESYCLKAQEVYSPPLSDRRVFTLYLVRFSTSANHREKTVGASSFDLSEYAQTFHVQSSAKVMKYREPPSDLSGIGPHISEWICSRGFRTVS